MNNNQSAPGLDPSVMKDLHEPLLAAQAFLHTPLLSSCIHWDSFLILQIIPPTTEIRFSPLGNAEINGEEFNYLQSREGWQLLSLANYLFSLLVSARGKSKQQVEEQGNGKKRVLLRKLKEKKRKT